MSSETTGSTGFYEFLAWLEENRKRLIVGFVIAVVVGLGIAFYRWKSDQTEWAANAALLKLRPASSPAERTTPAGASDYQKVVDQYPNTDAAERALLLAAGASFTENKYSEAQAQFERFLKENGGNPLAPTAAYGKAASLEAQGKFDEALSAYQNVLTQHPRSTVVTDTRFAIARLYEAKKQPDLALKTYEEMTRTNTASSKGTEAMMRKEALLSKYPELAKTNAPAIVATNTPPRSATDAPSQKTTNIQALSSTNVPVAATNAPAAKPE